MDLQRSHNILQQRKDYLLLYSDVTEKVHAALNPAVHCAQGHTQVTRAGRKCCQNGHLVGQFVSVLLIQPWLASQAFCSSMVNNAGLADKIKRHVVNISEMSQF